MMKKYSSNSEVLQRYLCCRDQTIIDVGCGNGDTVRWLAEQGARVTGLDSREMLVKARANPVSGTEKYLEGGAQRLPFADESADSILYLASFHHVPVESMAAAARECLRVLKNGGSAVFVEPVYRTGAYCEVTSLVDNEEDILKKAYATITSLADTGLVMKAEEFFHLERSFSDYVHMLEFFVDDALRREAILAQARTITENFSTAAGKKFADFRYGSICRLNILVKNNEQT